MRDMNDKKKIIIFEELNFFNCLTTVLYSGVGFNLAYFSISDKIKTLGPFKFLIDRFLKDDSIEKIFTFDMLSLTNEYVFNNIDAIFKDVNRKSKSINIMKGLFNSDLIGLAYKKVISEKLFLFYRTQIILNAFLKDKTLEKAYFVPSEPYMYFMNFREGPGFSYILNRAINIPGYAYVINSVRGLFKKAAQISLLALWPFMLMRDTRKIRLSKPCPKEYKTAIRVYKAGYNFKAEYRSIDFLIDGKDITKEATLFCIETEIDKDFRDELVKKQYNFVDITSILKEVNLDFIKDVYFKIIPVYMSLCVASILEPFFIIHMERNILGLYLRWRCFLNKYAIKNFVVYNDITFTHIIRNILLSQQGVKTWYYLHSTHTVDLFTPPRETNQIRSAYFSCLLYDNLISWGRKFSSFYMEPYNRIGNFAHIGCLWSEHVRKIAEAGSYTEVLNKIYAKCRQNTTPADKKIIGIFDTSFGGTAPLSCYDMKYFLKGILELKDERDDFIFILKLKNQLKDIARSEPEAILYYQQLKEKKDIYLLEDTEDSTLVIAMSDLVISACFTSTTNEALGFRKKAIFFDATGRFRGYYYDRFPNLVAHGYDELVKLADHWLYGIKDEEFSEYIDKYIKDEIDSHTDGMAITRFRELLMK